MIAFRYIAFVVLFCSLLRSTAFQHHRTQITSTPPRSEIRLLPIENQRTQGHGQYIMLCAGKGFGKGDEAGSDSQLARTTAQQSKEVVGSYSKLLSKQAKKFEDMKKAGGQANKDIYARLKGSEICWFIGIFTIAFHDDRSPSASFPFHQGINICLLLHNYLIITSLIVGKCIHVPSMTDEDALENLSPLLIEYAKSLRPVELAKQNAMNSIEIW